MDGDAVKLRYRSGDEILYRLVIGRYDVAAIGFPEHVYDGGRYVSWGDEEHGRSGTEDPQTCEAVADRICVTTGG